VNRGSARCHSQLEMQFLQILWAAQRMRKCQNSLTGKDAALDVNDASFCVSVGFDVDRKRQKCEGGSSVCLGDTISSVLFPFQVLFILASI
jgi:hypothetical protein